MEGVPSGGGVGRSRLETIKYGAHTRKQSLASEPGKQILGSLGGLGSLRARERENTPYIARQQMTYHVAAQDAAC